MNKQEPESSELSHQLYDQCHNIGTRREAADNILILFVRAEEDFFFSYTRFCQKDGRLAVKK
jgi:hypothetical protein